MVCSSDRVTPFCFWFSDGVVIRYPVARQRTARKGDGYIRITGIETRMAREFL